MIRWGIIGLGNMANTFAKAINEVPNSKLINIASQSKHKLDSFAKNFKIESINKFDNYIDLIKSKEIDAVYISTLNNQTMPGGTPIILFLFVFTFRQTRRTPNCFLAFFTICITPMRASC